MTVPALARAGGIVARAAQGIARITQRKGLQAYGALAITSVIAGGLLVFAIERDQEGANITSGRRRHLVGRCDHDDSRLRRSRTDLARPTMTSPGFGGATVSRSARGG
jgi:hypothetical protein